MMEKSKKAFLPAAAAVVLWGMLSPLTKTLIANIPAFELLAVESFFAFLFLSAVVAIRSRGRAALPMHFPRLIGLGFLGLFLYTALYNNGIALLTASEACIINYLWPAALVIFSFIILKEPFSPGKLAAVFLSFFGVFIMMFTGNSTGNLTGYISCILAALCYGLFSVLNKLENPDQFSAMAIYFGVTALCAFIISLIFETPVMPTASQWLGLMFLGIFSNGAAYLCWGIALNSGDTAAIANLAFLTPVVTVIISRLFLGERLRPASIAGLACILGGIAIQIINKRKASGKNRHQKNSIERK